VCCHQRDLLLGSYQRSVNVTRALRLFSYVMFEEHAPGSVITFETGPPRGIRHVRLATLGGKIEKRLAFDARAASMFGLIRATVYGRSVVWRRVDGLLAHPPTTKPDPARAMSTTVARSVIPMNVRRGLGERHISLEAASTTALDELVELVNGAAVLVTPEEPVGLRRRRGRRWCLRPKGRHPRDS